MNIQEYISTGVLQAYLLDELSDVERAAVETALARYPELRHELVELELTQEALHQRAAIAPPVEMKRQVLAKLKADKPMRATVSSLNTWRYATAASVALAVAMAYLAITYRAKWMDAKNSLTAMLLKNEQLTEDYRVVNQRLDKIEKDTKIIESAAFTKIILLDTKSADARASVYWNSATQEVFLSIHNMRALARENQYQLWAIIDGKPVDVGVFDVANGLIRMKTIGKGAATFAITVEPWGGRPVPTLEALQAAGQVPKV